MNKTGFYFNLLSIGLLLLVSGGALAADIEAGRVASTQCAICHGVDGKGNGIPGSSISGIEAEVFVKHLRDFKTGTRRNVMMQMFANRLNEEDFENLAAYYAMQ